MELLSLKKLLLLVLSGGMTGLAFSFPKLFFLNWFSLVPLLLIIKNQQLKKSFLSGSIAGLVFFLSTFYWLLYPQLIFELPFLLAIIFTVLSCIILAIFWGFFALIASYVLKNRQKLVFLLLPSLWIGLEYLRELLIADLTLGFIGYSQAYFPLVIQIASIFGVYGVSFFIVLLNTLIYKLILYIKGEKQIIDQQLLLVSLIISLVFIYGVVNLHSSFEKKPKQELSFGLMQPNIAQEIKWDYNYREQIMNTYFELSEKLRKKEVDLIIWPETAVPFVLTENNNYFWQNYLLERIKELETVLFFGALNKKESNTYNQNFLIDKELNIIDSYSKMKLVPFGEYMPFRNILPSYIETLVSDKTPGTKKTNFNFQGITWASPICSEILNPNLVNKLTADNKLLINVSNEAWFKSSNAPVQIWQAAILRAVENRIPIIKVSNTGVSGVIDSQGQIVKRLEPFEKEAVAYSLAFNAENSANFYQLMNIFLKLILLLNVILFFDFILSLKQLR
ncbi:apolipoprotein N-acyltransferase [Fuchsiella alkaliacetigena]|uniref:apolipoprotein N-acyltransferase n=1 Tax=Fuchsiella alkaliacetigena TaxID=957042 RepID=UPI00200AEC2D|nr:apolipoprotein N-acyltransferase [Fuchsiella alkaliacetigena]MCK8825014.1 apolipoprotein N-acyltransferase [Fuchsiella alkaliacetigena]